MVPVIALALTGCVEFWSMANDWDDDGYTVAQGDCADVDPDIHPGVEEVWYDGVDQNCDDNDGDQDGDGWVPAAYQEVVEDWAVFGAHEGIGDCWDDPLSIPSEFRVVSGMGWEQPDSEEVYPEAEDLWYDGVDANCQGEDDFDQDGDGWRTFFHPDVEGLVGEDCIDGAIDDAVNPAGLNPAEINPGALETWYDGTDQDCSDPASWDGDPADWSDYDADGDGYPSGVEGSWDDVAEDCDDTDSSRYPNLTIDELWYDCYDQDCDGNDGDQDGDGVLAEGYEDVCSDTWDDPAFFGHGGETGDCWDDPEMDQTPLNGHDPVSADQIYPGGEEVWYDGIDSDCAEDSDFDMDQDGHDAVGQDNDSGVAGDDCDDMDAAVNPGQLEDCGTEVDDDCTGTANDENAIDCISFFEDGDEDGFGGSGTQCLCEALPPFLFLEESDCDDDNEEIHPGADEYCDLVDWDCDEVVDEAGSVDATTWYADSDGDGFGDVGSTQVACSQPSLYGLDDQDCDDLDSTVNPDAIEVCNSIDDDCDESIDEEGTPDGTLYFVDADGDGYGDDADAGETYCSDPGSGYSTVAEDCDDADSAINSGATEVCDELDVDEDCDGLVDDDDPTVDGTTLFYTDADEDGFGDETDLGTGWCDPPGLTSSSADDCDDGNDAVYPGAEDAWYDGVDADCAGDDDYDADVDGYQRQEDGGTDCDDADDAIHPAAQEVCDEALVDEDCDGLSDDDDTSVTGTVTWFADNDGDGYGDVSSSVEACLAPSGHVSFGGDCDDEEELVHLGALEICDGLDNDCDTDTDEGRPDADGDGTCDGIDAEDCDGVDNDGDVAVDEDLPDSDTDGICDDLDTEECDEVDNDGDGLVDDDDDSLDLSTTTDWYEDQDGDGFGDSTDTPDQRCLAPSGTVTDNTDCDDAEDTVSPGATERCDGQVNDCDASGLLVVESDDDGDGFVECTLDADGWDGSGSVVGGEDCDDADPGSFPGGTETCDGTADEDCDGEVDEAGATDALTWYADVDADGFGNADDATIACESPSSHVADDTDCDDGDSSENPDVTWYADSDGDTYGDPDTSQTCERAETSDVTDSTDCDDGDSGENPDVTWYTDADGDAYGDFSSTSSACERAEPSDVEDATDCDDGDAAVNPDATEVCNSVDDDCNGDTDDDDSGLDTTTGSTWHPDFDSDGYGNASISSEACIAPTGTVADGSDCDDLDAEENPDVTWYPDVDGDTFGDPISGNACERADPDDVTDNTDCDDGDAEENPEVTWYADVDGDTFGDPFSSNACERAASGDSTDSTDCDDLDAEENPDVTWYADADEDGFGDPLSSNACERAAPGDVTDSTDCDDGDASTNPVASEVDDLVDQDCDDAVDEDFWAEGDLVLTEIMADPSGTQPEEEWIELTNVSGAVVMLDGLFMSPECGSPFVVSPESWILPNGASMVFCHDDAQLGVDCDYVYGSDVHGSSALSATYSEDFCLDEEAGGVSMESFLGITLDQVQWTADTDGWPASVVGSSWVLDPGAVDHLANDDGSNWCFPQASETFGSGDFGTPGALATCQSTPP